ncbi:hypothetical protein [Candidatus Phytoplasma prunorum]
MFITGILILTFELNVAGGKKWRCLGIRSRGILILIIGLLLLII